MKAVMANVPEHILEWRRRTAPTGEMKCGRECCTWHPVRIGIIRILKEH